MNKAKTIGVKEKDKPFRFLQSKVFKADLDNLEPGRYELRAEKYRRNKSNAQLGYLFSAIYPFVLKGLNDAGWEFTNLEEIDAYCKSMFADREVINRTTGEIMNVPGLKRDMTTVEMMVYVNSIRDWASEFLNIYIPEPGEQTNFDFD